MGEWENYCWNSMAYTTSEQHQVYLTVRQPLNKMVNILALANQIWIKGS